MTSLTTVINRVDFHWASYGAVPHASPAPQARGSIRSERLEDLCFTKLAHNNYAITIPGWPGLAWAGREDGDGDGVRQGCGKGPMIQEGH